MDLGQEGDAGGEKQCSCQALGSALQLSSDGFTVFTRVYPSRAPGLPCLEAHT